MIQRRAEATIADLYKVPEKAELVNGEIVIMSPGQRRTRADAWVDSSKPPAV